MPYTQMISLKVLPFSERQMVRKGGFTREGILQLWITSNLLVTAGGYSALSLWGVGLKNAKSNQTWFTHQ